VDIKTALVVDDSKVASLTLSKMLTKRAIAVDNAPSGEEALQYLKYKRPDIIFMDVLMPGMDGYEAAQSIAADPGTAGIPVIMCTAKESADDRQKAFTHGAKGFVIKPVTEDGLSRVLQAIQALPAEAVTAEKVRVPEAQEAARAEDTVRMKALRGLTEAEARSVAEMVAAEVAETVANTVAATTAHAVAAKIAEDIVRGTSEKVAQDVVSRAVQKALPEMVANVREGLLKELEIQAIHLLRDQSAKFITSDAVKHTIAKLVENTAVSVADAVAKKAAKQMAEEAAQKTARRVAEDTVKFVATKAALSAAASSKRATIALAVVVFVLFVLVLAHTLKGTFF
jgi:CheY-like chemotaxis protein